MAMPCYGTNGGDEEAESISTPALRLLLALLRLPLSPSSVLAQVQGQALKRNSYAVVSGRRRHCVSACARFAFANFVSNSMM